MSAENEVIVATDVAAPTEEKQENATVIDFKMVTFSLAEKDYAIDIMHVKEIAKAGRFTYVPNTLPFVLGVYNLRGEIIPILDLRLFFNIDIPERDENKLENLLILMVDDQKFGVVVDKIDKVVGVQRSTVQPPHPLFGDISLKYIDGVVESGKRLYVLLNVEKIFSSKESVEERQLPTYNAGAVIGGGRQGGKAAPAGQAKVAANPSASSSSSGSNGERKGPPLAQAAEKTPADLIRGIRGDAAPSAPVAGEVDLKFVKDSLANYKKFYVSSVNESWVRHRYSEWTKEKGDENAQLQNQDDADKFLKPFWSPCSDAWWTKDYAEAVEKLLPDNSAKQIIVWNPGCGKGMETYSLACVLRRKYPEAKIRVYAQDVDLLNVSNASLLSVPANLSSDWYSSYLTKKANGEYTFSQEIKDSIMFEYHDCKNTNALPMVDIVFARDVLSLLDEAAQETVVADFLEKMKGNAIAIIGENEAMPSSFNFGEKNVGTLVAYTKE